MNNLDESETARRLLIYAPVGRDARLTEEVLTRAAIQSRICLSLRELCAVFEEDGAGAILLTEEALEDGDFHELVTSLERQPPWSDISVLLFGGSRGSDATRQLIRSIDALRNVTVLERPMRVATVFSMVRGALRSRVRQYEVRDLLVALHRARTDAETANRLKDEFLATLSHELRTPLNAILGWTTMLTQGQVDAERLPHVFDTLERNARAQARLIADVLDVSRIVTGKLQLKLSLVDGADVMRRALDSIRPAALAKGIEVRADLEEFCWVRGDADRLQQVFWNLLSNAVKFTPAGGLITVRVHTGYRHLEVAVTDTGAGIERSFLPFVFDRFRQADQSTTRTHGGLGLGLALAKHLVELHGGIVQVTSDGIGRGATFRVLLPAVEAGRQDVSSPLGSSVQAAPEFSISFAGRRILVVDDDPATRDLLKAVLGGAGAEVIAAGTAGEALHALQTRPPDVLVADLGMPDEDGFSLIRRVRQSSAFASQLPALALSAYADAESREAALDAGYTTFLEKPARPQDLLRVIDQMFVRHAR